MSKKVRCLSAAVLIVSLSIISICSISRNYVQASKVNEVIYTVKEGDCLSTIAYKYKQKYENAENLMQEIKYRNNINDYIDIGQVLIIPVREW